MKVHEYQAKELLKGAGVAVPEGVVVTRPEEAARAYDALGDGLVVVKAQVHAGGRGKGAFLRQFQDFQGPRAMWQPPYEPTLLEPADEAMDAGLGFEVQGILHLVKGR